MWSANIVVLCLDAPALYTRVIRRVCVHATTTSTIADDGRSRNRDVSENNRDSRRGQRRQTRVRIDGGRTPEKSNVPVSFVKIEKYLGRVRSNHPNFAASTDRFSVILSLSRAFDFNFSSIYASSPTCKYVYYHFCFTFVLLFVYTVAYIQYVALGGGRLKNTHKKLNTDLHLLNRNSITIRR